MSSLFDEARVWKVTAGPGCGKSHFIMGAINDLLTDGVRLSEIAYILFNRAPAQAFREQLRAKGYADDDMPWIGTHHSMCKRLLRLSSLNILNTATWGKAHGFDLSTEEKIRTDGLDEYGWDAVFASLQRGIYEGRTDFTREEKRLHDALKETEVKEGKFTFIRFLEKALRLDMFPVGVKYVFVDEAQDNGKIQFDWLRRVIENRPEVRGVVLAGDDKQAINSFKGGNPELFLDFPCDRHIDLQTTYRLPPRILREANRIIEPVRKRSELTSQSASPFPGLVAETQTFEDCIPDIADGIRARKSVLILLRNRCFELSVRNVLLDNDILIESEWSVRLQRILFALWEMRTTRRLRDTTLSTILPDERMWGTLQEKYCFEDGQAKRLRTQDFWTDQNMFQAYEELYRGEGLPVGRWRDLGMKERFIQDVLAWDLKPEAVNLPANTLFAFRDTLRRFGWGFRTVRVETIHAVKGEEADIVVLVGNITERTRQSEYENEDSERRVWFVGASRAKEKLILTNLPQYEKRTCIL